MMKVQDYGWWIYTVHQEYPLTEENLAQAMSFLFTDLHKGFYITHLNKMAYINYVSKDFVSIRSVKSLPSIDTIESKRVDLKLIKSLCFMEPDNETY